MTARAPVPVEGDVEDDADAYPPLARRYCAAAVDSLVLLGGTVALGTLLGDVPPRLAPLRAALFVALWMGYEPACTAYAATVGQRVFGFRVRRASDPARRIGLPAAWLRYAVKLALGLVSFLTMGMTRRQRAIHDLVSGSVAIEVRALPTVGHGEHRSA